MKPSTIHRLTWIALSFLSLTATGCIQSVNPLSDEKTSKIDERLLGKWEFVNTAQPAEQMIVAQKEGTKNTLEIRPVPQPGDDPESAQQTDLFTVEFGGHHYLSVLNEGSADPLVYWIVRYNVVGDELKVSAVDGAVLAAAVSKGEIAGKSEKKGDFDNPVGPDSESVILTASTEEVRAYLEKNADTVYAKKLEETILKRVK